MELKTTTRSEQDSLPSPVVEVTIDETNIPITLSLLWKYSDKLNFVYFIISSLSSIVTGLAHPLLFYFFSDIASLFYDYTVDQLHNPVNANNRLRDRVNEACFIVAMMGILVGMAGYLQHTLWNVMGERQSLKLRKLYFRGLLSQECNWYQIQDVDQLTQQVTTEMMIIQSGVGDKLGLLIQYLATFVGGIGIGLWQGWKLTVILISIVPLIIVVGGIFHVIVSKLTLQLSSISLASFTNELFTNIRTVYTFNGMSIMVEKYRKLLRQQRSIKVLRSLWSGTSFGLIMGLVYSSYGLSIWYSGHLIAIKEIQPKVAINIFLSVILGSVVLGQIHPTISALISSYKSFRKLVQVMERGSELNPFLITQKMLDQELFLNNKLTGEIEFNQIQFQYPKSNKLQLNKVSLHIPAGSQVALVGASGSGKSTLINLLERYNDPQFGTIFVDGVDIKSISSNFLRNHIGLVNQNPVLFNLSIKDNILLGLSEIPDDQAMERVIHACQQAHIHEFIMSLPNQYATIVGNKGSQLSGGQQQRLAIARAIIKNPPILLLDEATSALDTESERLVQIALDAVRHHRTTLTVAHRLSTIQHADLIVVLDQGQIIEQGTHQELLRWNSHYKQLVLAQTIDTEGLPNQINTGNEIEVITKPNDEANETYGCLSPTQSNQKPYSYFELFSRVWQLSYPYKLNVILGLLGAGLEGSILPLFSLIMTKVTQSYFYILIPPKHQQGLDDTLFWAKMSVVLGLLSWCLLFLWRGLLKSVGDQLSYDIQLKSLECNLQQDMSYFDEHQPGGLTSKLELQTQQATEILTRWLGSLFNAMVCISVGLSVSFYSSWKLSLVALGCLPINILGQFMNQLSQTSHSNQSIYLRVTNLATESITNIRTITSLNQPGYFYNKYVKLVHQAYVLAIKNYIRGGYGYAIANSAPLLTATLLFWYGTKLVTDTGLKYQDLFQVVTVILCIGISLGYASLELNSGGLSFIAISDIINLWESQPKIPNNDRVGHKHLELRGQIQVQDGEFSYPTRPEIKILRGLSLEITKYQTVALVGGSGSGKSTMIGLLQRFYNLSSGSMLVDHMAIDHWNPLHLRSQLAVVSQDAQLFNLSIADNIAFGMIPPPAPDQIIKAAKLAHIHHIIKELPQGYLTLPGVGGQQLSGGQRQRLALARAFIRYPRLLLLDEATSALDTLSESFIQSSLIQQSQQHQMTTLIIAHRLSTIQQVDQIFVMDRGLVTERGTHQELLSKGGIYTNLCQQQTLSP